MTENVQTLSYLTVAAPIILGVLGCWVWGYYTRAHFISTRKRVLLEISAHNGASLTAGQCMEALAACHQRGRGGVFARMISGVVSPWFSLEIAADAGGVRYFIWTEAVYRPALEAALSQASPGINIRTTEDYAEAARFNPRGGRYTLYGFECIKRDRGANIKTYDIYGNADPLADLGAFFASMERGERVWFQVLIRGARSTRGHDLSFDGGIRVIALSDVPLFRASRIVPLKRAIQAVSAEGFDEIIPTHATDVRYPWQDFRGMRAGARLASIYNAYVRRSYFYPPYVGRRVSLSRAEVATLFHMITPTRTDTVTVLPPVTKPSAAIAAHRPSPPENLPL